MLAVFGSWLAEVLTITSSVLCLLGIAWRQSIVRRSNRRHRERVWLLRMQTHRAIESTRSGGALQGSTGEEPLTRQLAHLTRALHRWQLAWADRTPRLGAHHSLFHTYELQSARVPRHIRQRKGAPSRLI